ncbi:MAG: type II toxin-antitoxin system VapC family toxin [Xanthobacteraceae bacterium]
MVIDTSALVAILFHEAEGSALKRVIAAEPRISMSIVTFYEASVVTALKKSDGYAAGLVDEFIRSAGIEIVPLDLSGSMAAREAYFRFGKGFHPARLNLADCFSYVLAKTRDEPLLFKGDDFAKTDIAPAWRP